MEQQRLAFCGEVAACGVARGLGSQQMVWPEHTPKPQRRILDMHAVYGSCEGRRCKTCGHFRRYTQSKTWFKCRKSRTSNSEATDWRANWPACGLWFCRHCNGDGRDSMGDPCKSCGGIR